MCLAIPGKIIRIEKDIAIVDYGSEKRQANMVVGDFSVGDFVIVQGKIVVEKVPAEQVQQWLDLLAESKKA